MKNWKTTLFGLATLFAAVSKIIAHDGAIDTQDLATITAGIGLLTAKDFDKSHSKP